MRCDQARRLFDSYLDGDLSPALATELGAHRIRCAECRRALALLEVSGQIIASDSETVSLGEDFSSRLLACMEPARRGRRERLWQMLYYAAPLTAAAVIALAFVGVFDRSNGTTVRGIKVENPAAHSTPSAPESAVQPSTAKVEEAAGAERALEEWIDRTRRNIQDKRQSGKSLHRALDLTIGQWLDILEQASDTSPSDDHYPGADVTTGPDEDASGDAIRPVDIGD
ncbi:MAG: zf-HC2 domain-containing protein [Phycisphaerae bacterium]